jgi:hypothetical protein
MGAALDTTLLMKKKRSKDAGRSKLDLRTESVRMLTGADKKAVVAGMLACSYTGCEMGTPSITPAG